MQVDLALQVNFTLDLCKSLASQFPKQLTSSSEVTETAKFVGVFDKFFDTLNARNYNIH